MNNTDFLWVEKYRPQTIEDCILPDNAKKMFQEFLNKKEIPNLLLSGPPGIGKTTVAKALCNQLGVDYYVINGSDEGRFLDTVRNQAKNFASTVSLSAPRISWRRPKNLAAIAGFCFPVMEKSTQAHRLWRGSMILFL